MKADIHPKYIECQVSCACGNKFATHSVKAEIRTDICSACHPYYTGAAEVRRLGRAASTSSSSATARRNRRRGARCPALGHRGIAA
jgi:large subunit ribosomal protein L31